MAQKKDTETQRMMNEAKLSGKPKKTTLDPPCNYCLKTGNISVYCDECLCVYCNNACKDKHHFNFKNKPNCKYSIRDGNKNI